MMVHDFKVKLSGDDFEGAMGLNFKKQNFFMVAKMDGEVTIYKHDSFDETFRMKIPLNKSKTREKI